MQSFELNVDGKSVAISKATISIALCSSLCARTNFSLTTIAAAEPSDVGLELNVCLFSD